MVAYSSEGGDGCLVYDPCGCLESWNKRAADVSSQVRSHRTLEDIMQQRLIGCCETVVTRIGQSVEDLGVA